MSNLGREVLIELVLFEDDAGDTPYALPCLTLFLAI